MPFLHSKNVINTKLLFSPLHNKAVGVKQEYHREKSNDNCAQSQHKLYIHGTKRQFIQSRIVIEVQHGIKECHRQHPGQQIRQVKLSVVLYIIYCQFSI